LHDAIPDVLASVRDDLWATRFGHIADGSLHVNILTGDGTPPPPEADAAIWQLAASLGGTISAEHGIGVAKAPWLDLVRSPAEQLGIEQLRTAWDPVNIFNPHIA
jgi:FAD/FMN-containing dehydrogenase